MPCGKRPLVKLWDKPKNIRHIKPSRYEQNEASVKVHWKNVIKSLEMSYKDEKFWDTHIDVVRELVGPTIFQRIAKIFDLPVEAPKYALDAEEEAEEASIVPSELYYVTKPTESAIRAEYSLSDFKPEEEVEEEEQFEEESDAWTDSTMVTLTQSVDKKKSKMKSLASAPSMNLPKSISKLLSKSFSRFMLRTLSTMDTTSKTGNVKTEQFVASSDTSAFTSDDLLVAASRRSVRSNNDLYDGPKRRPNPHFDMLYCNESETDMIKWDSHYKTKTFEVSASDEFSKRAEILTKQIAKDFYDWWVGLGTVEFKSEIKRPEDIETLFQVWFDEHASRGIVLNPKIIPCVLKSIAVYTNAKRASCPNALKRQIAYDIQAETMPAHIMAFGTSLPEKMKHIPPKNNTEKLWHGVQIPEDLRTMAYVWGDIQHLTSTKAFHRWLLKHPNLPMPPCLKSTEAAGGKQLFVVPSDYFAKEKQSSASITQELALPVSQFSLELKQVLSKLMNE